VPLSPQNHALSIGMISYDGQIYFGIAGDRDVLADLDDLATALREALREQPAPRATAKPKRKRPRSG
jgi:diacylglycerol O-acyltransferase / wax synthase